MNKLTEIKRSYEQVKRNAHKYPQMGDRYYQIRMDDLGYLISLLEEKDKALNEIRKISHEDSYVHRIARKALNTSHNTEGDKP